MPSPEPLNSNDSRELSPGTAPGRDTLMGALIEIHAHSDLGGLIHRGEGLDSKVLERSLQSIRDVLARLSVSAPFTELPTSLSAAEYVLPPELAGQHAALVEHLRSTRTNQERAFSGLLLHGVRGTGKTEYAQHLRHEVGDKARVVQASVSAIRNSPAPGETLRKLILDIEARAVRDGRYHVLVLDEGDQLFAPFSREVSTKRTRSTTQASEKRSIETRDDETTNAATIDAAGADLLAALKSVLGNATTRVFLIVTSNRDTFPPEVYRDGRLERIELKPVGILEHSDLSIHACPVYDDYRRIIPRVIALMQAKHVRIHRVRNPVLDQLGDDFHAFFAEEPVYSRSDVGSFNVFQNNGRNFAETNTALLTKLLARFGFSIDFETLPYRAPSRSPWSHEMFVFSGVRVKDRYLNLTFERTETESAEWRRARSCIPSEVVGAYISEKKNFSTLEGARAAVARFLFPQLEHYSLYREACNAAAEDNKKRRE